MVDLIDPRKHTITLCSSTTFYSEMPGIKEKLQGYNYNVLTPDLRDCKNLDERILAELQAGFIREHFAKIDKSQAVYIINHEKNDIRCYVGPNVLMEISHAFYRKIPIFLSDSYSRKLNCYAELLVMEPIIIDNNLEKLHNIMKQKYEKDYIYGKKADDDLFS
jgi:hypothetical protein